MDKFTRDAFLELAVYDAYPAVTIYLDTHKSGKEVNEGNDKIRFKNHLNEIARVLDRDRNNRDFLKPAFGLLEDQQFWTSQDQGLAVFLAPGVFKYYRMPHSFVERHVVSRKFQLTPMLRFCQKESIFYLLAISKADVKLYLCNEYKIHQLELHPDIPRSMDEALQYDVYEKQRQFHSAGRPPSGAIYHGQGGGEDRIKTDIGRYLKQVDNGLKKMLNGENHPLVIAAVDYLIPIYRENSEYSKLIPHGITGNPEHIPDNELHQKALDLILPLFEKEKLEAIDRFRNLSGSEIVSDEIGEIVPASKFSKVDVLFVTDETPVWGKFDESTTGVEVHRSYAEGDEDLLNRAATDTFLNGGRVFLFDKDHLPVAGKHAAAIYRFS